MNFDNNAPIYIQIMDHIKSKIVSGELSCGEKIKSVRDFAQDMKVNPNTMQKALSALEQEGLIHTERTSGKYVTNDAEIIQKLKNEMICKMTSEFFNSLQNLGIQKEEVIELVNNYFK